VIRQLLQARITEVVTEVIEEELTELLGSSRYTRTEGRRGYRNGRSVRTVTTEAGPMEIAVPRARVRQEDGSTGEFRSEILPRYARRTRRVDDAPYCFAGPASGRSPVGPAWIARPSGATRSRQSPPPRPPASEH
jgi:hypothetical protein